uniref:Uncharacterized protein n=1 Tax=Zooxanthella nutricula TaxID=1333877 RepID=A0A7S2PRJ9_9DINO
MNLATGGGATLLQQLLDCCRSSAQDKRFGSPGNGTAKSLTAQVSLLRDFEDISSDRENFTLGTHGLLYCLPIEGGPPAYRLYLPEVALKVAGGRTTKRGTQLVLQALADWKGGRDIAEESTDEEDEEDSEESYEDDDEASFPSNSVLYRFEAVSSGCPVANLPTMKTRNISREHLQQALVAQNRVADAIADGPRRGAQFAELTSVTVAGSATEKKEAGRESVRAFIVPTTGAYTGAQVSFVEGLDEARPEGLKQVRRIFVLASVWDCFIDGCGLPERRCAWYNRFPLDLVVLERLRGSRAFCELTVEQDMRERAIEVLLPIVGQCLDEGQEFTLVPVLVGGVMRDKASRYAELLAPYLADPANLFVVAGDMNDFSPSLNGFRVNGNGNRTGRVGVQRWLQEVPALMGVRGRVRPLCDAMELFLEVATQSAEREQLSLVRCW